MADEKGKQESRKDAHGAHGGFGKDSKPGQKQQVDAAKGPRQGPKIHDEGASHTDIRYIVRIAAKDLDGSLPVERALNGIKGVGIRMAKIMATRFSEVSGVSPTTPLGMMPEDKDKVLEDIVMHPESHQVPQWVFNRRKDLFTGKTSHSVMSDLDFTLRKDLQLMMETKSYKGLRHTWGLPVRGQRTKSTHRGKGGVVGVLKKDAKAAAAPPAKAGAPSAAAAGAAKKEEKK